MTLRSYLRVLRERWKLLLLFVFVATAAAAAITVLTPKSYQATAQVLVSTSVTSDPSLQVQAQAYVATEVATFIQATPDPQLWAWYGAYDHVVLCQLWGPMIALPDGVPMFTNDLKQEAVRLGDPELPEQPAGVHNALADAHHNLVRARALDVIATFGKPFISGADFFQGHTDDDATEGDW